MLANRLSANPEHRVLLLEAGGEGGHFWLRLPVGYFRTIYDPRFSWQFPLEPQAETDNRAIVWPRGRVLGGSSAINGLIYIRGQHADFDDWAALGAHGWSYRDVLPFFKRSERYDGGESEYHGADGELCVSDLRNDHSHCAAWVAAGAEAGYPLNPDFNGAESDGLGAYQLNLRGRWRCDAASAFLAPVRAAPQPDRADRRAGHARADRARPRRRRRVARRAASCSARRPSARRSSPPARCSRRSCCSSPASARRRCCASTASRSRSMRPRSAPTCRTTTRRASSSS